MAQLLDQHYEIVPIESLCLLDRNPNQGDLDSIASSIEHNDFYGAVIVQRSSNTIIAGNHRVEAARRSGMSEVPVLWIDVDDEAARRISLADNRTTRLGQDDDQLLAEVLSALATTDDALSGTGFDGDDLDDLLTKLSEPEKKPQKPVVGWRISVDVPDEAKADELCNLLAAHGHAANRAARR